LKLFTANLSILNRWWAQEPKSRPVTERVVDKIRGDLNAVDEMSCAGSGSFHDAAFTTINNFQADIKVKECGVDFSRQQEESALSIHNMFCRNP